MRRRGSDAGFVNVSAPWTEQTARAASESATPSTFASTPRDADASPCVAMGGRVQGGDETRRDGHGGCVWICSVNNFTAAQWQQLTQRHYL